jgi:hypothetical protein
MDGANNVIGLNFDGLFYDSIAQTTHVTPNQVFHQRYASSHSEQIHIHQSMLNSLFFALEKTKMPLKIKSASASAQVKQLIHEISVFYGQDCSIAIEATLSPQSETAITLNKTTGVVVGGNNDVLVTLAFYASNATTNYSLAAEFQMNFAVVLNITMIDFIINLHINDVSIHNTKVTKDNVGVYARNYDVLFTSLLNMEFSQINSKYQNGFDLRTLDPNAGNILSMFKNSTVTPF